MEAANVRRHLLPCARRCRGAAGAVLLALLALAGRAAAQSPANAGHAPREVAPAAQAPQAPAEPSFVLQGVRFSGATLFSEAQLQALAAPFIGRRVTLATLEDLARTVTQRYRAAGYALAQALVPPQEVADGVVGISVLEGRLGQVQVEVDPDAPLDEARAQGFVAGLRPGEPLRQEALGRAMLLLSDLPGVSPQASLEPGREPGSTDLALGIEGKRRWDLAFDADNHGSRATSKYRAGLQGRWNSPLRIGDNLDFRLQHGSGGGLTFGRLGYERPLGHDGHRAGLALSTLEYALGQDFAALDAHGRARIAELFTTYPFIRSRVRNLFGKLSLQRKWLEDHFDAVPLDDRKQINSLNLALNYESSDALLGGGFNSAGLGLSVGRLRLGSGQDDTQRRTAGRFAHLNYNLARLNALTPSTNLYLGLSGQFASKNLDSVEKVTLGGPNGVRAYAPSEATADEAHVFNAELRYSLTPDISLQGFWDWGRARLNRKPLPLDMVNTVTLHGAGVGAFWTARKGLVLRASLAWRGGTVGRSEADRNPRLYLQLSYAL